MWGDHEFRNNIGFDSVASISDGAWTPGKGAWDGTYNGIMPPKMNTAANHAEAQNWMLDLGNTLIITPDAITKGGGAGDGALFGSTQISEILAAVNNAKWEFVVLMMSNGIRYMSTSAQNDSTTYLANSTLADEKPTEYAQLFTNTGGIQDLSNTLGFKFVLIHGDHHNPSVINHQNTDGTVNEQFTSFTSGSINGSQNFVTDASVLTNSTYRGSTVVWQDESRKEANKPTQGPTHRASIARVDILTETIPKKLVVTLVDDGWDEVYVGEYQVGQTGNLAAARTADVVGQPPTLTPYNNIIANVDDTLASVDLTSNFSGHGTITVSSSSAFPAGIDGSDLTQVSGDFTSAGTFLIKVDATNDYGTTTGYFEFVVSTAISSNKNFLSPVGFELKIDSSKYPNLEYFCTGSGLPAISMSEAPVPYKGANIGFVGDRINFDDFTVRFNVTEDMDNYIETFNWMQDIVNGQKSINELQSDAILLILNSHNNVTREIRFKDVFPTALSGLEFNANTTDIEYLTAEVTFKYSYFEIK